MEQKQANPSDNKLSLYKFVLDAGQDKRSMLQRIKRELLGVSTVMFMSVFCMMHQCHLITKSIIAKLDAWEVKGHKMATEYFAGAATIANVWRSTGTCFKIRSHAATLCGEDVAQKHFTKVPGRCLGGRWLSIDSCEQLIVGAMDNIGKVFVASCGSAVSSKRRKADIRADEDDQWKEEQMKHRQNAVALTSDNVFLSTVFISHKAKAPLGLLHGLGAEAGQVAQHNTFEGEVARSHILGPNSAF